MTGLSRVLLGALLAGWIADRLARPDGDVEAGIEAYEAGQLDTALERFEAAISRHGDRPELSYDRGLVLLAKGESAEARRAFERASESEDFEIRASAFYELGNVAFDAENYEAAIEAYIECLKARPDHGNAKWNLELALQRREQQKDEPEEEEEEEEEEEDESGSSTGGSSTGGSDTGSTGDDQGSTSDTGDTGGTGGTGGSEEGTSGGEEGEGTGDSGGTGGSEDEGAGEGDSGGESGEDQPPEDTDGGTGGSPPPQPEPLDQMDIQRALDELDEQDHFPLDRPVGGTRPPTEDW